MAALQELNTTLRHAAESLNRAAAQIRDLGMNPDENVRKIGEALTLIFEIQNQVYARRPSLTPKFLKKKKLPIRQPRSGARRNPDHRDNAG